jgi:MFS family permease
MLRIDRSQLFVIGSLALLTVLGLTERISPFTVLLVLVVVLLARLAQGLFGWGARTPNDPAAASGSSALAANVLGAILMAVGGMPLFGIFGLLAVVAATPVLAPFLGGRFLDSLPGYGGLGVVFLVNMVWPFSLVVAYLVAYRAYAAASKANKALIYCGVVYGGAVITTLGAYLMVLANA